MLATLFSSIVEFIFTIGILVFLYEVFLSDWIEEYRNRIKEGKAKLNSVEKIAQVKLVSESPEDIEKFITDNAQYLSGPTVSKLVARIDLLHNDSVIKADDLLKKRFENLELEEKELHRVKTTRS